MRNHQRFYSQACHVLPTALGVLLILAAGVYGETRQADMIRFDGVLELNASLLCTNVMLFARYWVSKDSYSIAIVWAEPAGSGLNYPTRPMTLTIDSNEASFSVDSQMQPGLASVFPKPIGERGIFRHALNSYPFGDIRFAERDALTTRIYRSDLKGIIRDANDAWQTIDIAGYTDANAIKREMGKLNVRAMDGRIDALGLIDVNGLPIKSIEYEYADPNHASLLRRQKVTLPERLMTVGWRGKGATITINGQQRTYRELPAFYHQGGRMCTIDYEPLKEDGSLLPVPVDIAVQGPDANNVLRTAHISNYVQVKISQKEAVEAAHRFALYDDKEMKVSQMMERCWLKPVSDLNDTDVQALRELRVHFEGATPRGKTVGEQLKRINLLLDLDQMQDHPDLQKHFRQYLAILTANNLNQMILGGGLSIIDTTARWHHLAPADRLLDQWLDAAIAVHSPASILAFADVQVRGNQHWIVAKLLEKSLKSQDWGQARLAGQVLRCAALKTLYDYSEKPESVKTEQAKAEREWVATSFGVENVTKALREGLSEANRTFAEIAEPTKQQKALKNQLDAIEKTLTNPEAPSAKN